MSIEIREIFSKAELKQFIDFPHHLYAGDPNYVPEIFLAMKDHLNRKKNPYFKHSDASLYLAFRDGKIVGRIAATVNNNYNDFHQCNVGFFGFFDAIEDQEVFKVLLEKAELYCKKAGVDKVLGPANFTTNDTSGLLVEGYDSPPIIQMCYNKPYYLDLLSKCGYGKEMDMFAYMILTKDVNQKALNLSAKLEERLNKRDIHLRQVNMKIFDQEVKKIKEIYRLAWEKNWGFVPPTDEEFDFLAEGLKLAINPDYVYIVEQSSKPIAFVVALPNLNEIIIEMKKGRLLPTGIFKLLTRKKKTKYVRVILLGVLEEYRKMGIEAILYGKMMSQAFKDNKVGGEASWILENNDAMNQAAKNLNGTPYKRYRIVSKVLS